jgi:hypothetical protein
MKNRKARARAWGIAICLAMACQAYAKKADLSACPFVKHMSDGDSAGRAIGAAVIDSEVYAESADNFANVRIVDDAEIEIPYLVREKTTAVTKTRERHISTRIEALRELPDNRIEIELVLTGKAVESQAVVIETPIRDFEKLVTIRAATSDGEWTELVSEAPIVDYTRFIDLRDTRIEFAPAAYRRFRLTISDVTLDRELAIKRNVREALHGETQREFTHSSFRREDFRIDTIRLLGQRTTETGERPVRVTREINDFAVENDGKRTVVTFSSQREPIDGIRLLTSGRNFSRPVRVEGKRGRSFTDLYRGTYRFISVGKVSRDNRTLRLRRPERCTEWRVTIDNADNPALAITGLVLEERVHEIVFLNSSPAVYRLIYGGSGTVKPSYDVSTILGVAGRSPSAAFTLGGQLDNEAYRRFNWRLRLGGQVVLSAAILLMVVALGWGVANAAKRIESVE